MVLYLIVQRDNLSLCMFNCEGLFSHSFKSVLSMPHFLQVLSQVSFLLVCRLLISLLVIHKWLNGCVAALALPCFLFFCQMWTRQF
jgi:hypothetical protein